MLKVHGFLATVTDQVIRDPVWGDIPITPEVKVLLDCADMQRLRGVSQLGNVALVYPGATHTRFQHSLGVYYLAVRLLKELVEQGVEFSNDDINVFLAASLLHDIGHYPYSHVLEGLPSYFRRHELISGELIQRGKIREALHEINVDPKRVANVIHPVNGSLKQSDQLLHNLLNGPIDPDKLDYLVRDAYYCGVPYGNLDVDRLIRSTRLTEDGTDIVITDRGIAPTESVIFSLYMMYRNVYWHHTVRIADLMLKRAVQDAIEDYSVSPQEFIGLKDSELFDFLSHVGNEDSSPKELIRCLENRHLYERIMTFQPGKYRRSRAGLYEEKPVERKEKEKELCAYLSSLVGVKLRDYDILIDVPFLDRIPRFDLEVRFRKVPLSEKKALQFDNTVVSLLGPVLVSNFENQTKKIRIVCTRRHSTNTSCGNRTLAEVIRDRIRENFEKFDII
jgi:HD superfamily phosphohydrolase